MAGPVITGAMLDSMNKFGASGKGVMCLLDITGVKGGAFPALTTGMSVSPLEWADPAKLVSPLTVPTAQIGKAALGGFGGGIDGLYKGGGKGGAHGGGGDHHGPAMAA